LPPILFSVCRIPLGRKKQALKLASALVSLQAPFTRKRRQTRR